MKIKHYLIICCSLFLWGCENVVVDEAAEPQGKKLVLIYGFISPDEEDISIKVSETASVFDNAVNQDGDLQNDLLIKDASVFIENEGGEEIQLPYSDTNLKYSIPSSSFAIEPGKQYILRVNAKGKEFTATCTIPKEKVEEFELSLNTRVSSGGVRFEVLSFNFMDFEGGSNFYLVGAKYREIGATTDFLTAFFGNERFTTDINGDGLSVVSSTTIDFTQTGLEVIAQVAHVDGLIHDTLKAFSLNRGFGADNPFFQPVVPPTNIKGEGGYGVFAGFRLTEKTEEIRR